MKSIASFENAFLAGDPPINPGERDAENQIRDHVGRWQIAALRWTFSPRNEMAITGATASSSHQPGFYRPSD